MKRQKLIHMLCIKAIACMIAEPEKAGKCVEMIDKLNLGVISKKEAVVTSVKFGLIDIKIEEKEEKDLWESKLSKLNLPLPATWTTATGKNVLISEMEDVHINNTLQLLLRNGKSRLKEVRENIHDIAESALCYSGGTYTEMIMHNSAGKRGMELCKVLGNYKFLVPVVFLSLLQELKKRKAEVSFLPDLSTVVIRILEDDYDFLDAETLEWL